MIAVFIVGAIAAAWFSLLQREPVRRLPRALKGNRIVWKR